MDYLFFILAESPSPGGAMKNEYATRYTTDGVRAPYSCWVGFIKQQEEKT